MAARSPARGGAHQHSCAHVHPLPRRLAHRRRPRRAGGDRGEGRQRARARLPARAARGDRRLRRLPDATAERARAAGADLVLELPRGGKIRAQDAAVRARARRDRRVLRRQRAAGSPTRCASWSRRSPTRASATPAGRSASSTGAAAPTRRALYWRYELAVRALESRLALDHRRQRRDLRHAPRRLHRRRPDHGPRPVAARSTWSSAGCAPSTCRRRARREKMVPTIEGEFARKRRMMSHTWPIVAARRPALAARLPAAVRADDRLAPRCCATPRRSCTCVALGANVALLGARRRRLRGRARAAARAAARGAAGALVARPPAADRPLLRPHHRLDRRRAVGLAAPRHRRPAGTPAEGTR